ncbi:MAG: S8 family serine peptidase [Calditrichaceae bacterium]
MFTSRFINWVSIFLILIFISLVQGEDWSFLNVTRTGASEFIKMHPEYNGKNVVVIILDTGVDMGVAGLKETPDGNVKVIDAQDFTGEGDVFLEQADKGIQDNESYLIHPDGHRLYGFEKLEDQPVDSVYYVGVLDEERFKNTVLPDINNNGETDQQFGVLVINGSNGWQAYIDLDADGNIDDEFPIRNYKESYQSFQFKGRDSEKWKNLATFALNIFPDELRVNFHYDGSSHGTHVAGIATGYKINGQEGLNGVAPGAKIISLKLGDGTLAGGSTRTGSMIKAYEYGVEFAKHYDGPVVFNMSFGIGSEIEGHADMEYILNDLLRENEKLLFCLSAGNEGPGISTIGLPAAAERVLTVGALNTKESARDVYRSDLKDDKIFIFSSRGGELNKPDLIAPGAASATVPPYSTSENKWGTSMASPQAAGAVALIMSAAYQQNPSMAINGAAIKKALKNSADFLSNYTPLDQGSGVINIPKAFDYYKRYMENQADSQIDGYEISTVCPSIEGESGPAAYWRTGTYIPTDTDKQKFYINPVFPEPMTADEQNDFYRAFNLVPDQPWIKVNQKSIYIKGSQAATVDVYFDKSHLQKPGLYSGRINAYRKGGAFSGNNPVNKEFDLYCSIVVPLTFDEDNNHSWTSPEINIESGNVERFFIKIPLMASSATINLENINSKYANIIGYLFDPEGREQSEHLRIDSRIRDEQTLRLSGSSLEPGIWELDLYAPFSNEKSSSVRLDIAFSGLESFPETISSVSIRNGTDPTGEFEILNHYNQKAEARISGNLSGYQNVQYIERESDNYIYTFNVNDDYEKVVFELAMEPEVFNMFTDFAINIKDNSGKALVQDGLSYRKNTIKFDPPVSGSYTLELIPAFADKNSKNWNIELKESYYFLTKIKLSGDQYDFYPLHKKSVNFSIKGTIPVAPDGFYLFGEIWIDSYGKKQYRDVIPVKLYTGIN